MAPNIASISVKATGSTFSRAWGDRLVEIRNVKDFGSATTGSGSGDDQPAIQAAIDSLGGSALNRGEIIFPPGTYNVASSSTFNTPGEMSIRFRGVGKLSTISGSFSDYLLKRDVNGGPWSGGIVVEDLGFVNGHATGGCLRLGNTIGSAVRGCTFSGYRGLNASSANGNINQSFTVDANQFSSNGIAGAIAIVVGGNCTVMDNDITGFHKAIVVYGTSVNILGNRMEVNRTGIVLGVLEDGTGSSTNNFTIIGNQYESCGTCIDFVGGSGNAFIGGNFMHGFEAAAPYEGVDVPSTTLTGTFSGATGTGTIDQYGLLTISGVSGTFLPGDSNELLTTDFITGTGVPTGTKLLEQKTGPAGGAGTYICSGAPQYGINFRDKCSFTTVSGNSVGGMCKHANINLDNSSNRAGIVFHSVQCSNESTLGGVTWDLPTTAHTAEWVNCDVQPTFLFAGLPGAPREGDRVYITNANTATLGNAVTAGGAPDTHGYVVWNGSAWTLASK